MQQKSQVKCAMGQSLQAKTKVSKHNRFPLKEKQLLSLHAIQFLYGFVPKVFLIQKYLFTISTYLVYFGISNVLKKR